MWQGNLGWCRCNTKLMLYKIARKITTEYLDTLSFADRTGGLVRLMNDHRKGEKSYPIEINQDKVLGDNQDMRKLVPNSNLTSLMYWEQDGSPTTVESHNNWYLVEGNLKLVCWFNYQKYDPDQYNPAYLISEIVATIPFKIGSFDCLAAVTCSYEGEDHNDGSIFTQYTYNEPESQFFKYPYEYVVLNFEITYRVVTNCFEEGLSLIPVTPMLIYMSGNAAKTVTIAGMSGKECQIEIYAIDLTTLTAKALHEYSGIDQDYTVTPKVGVNSIFKLDFGREYLRHINMPAQDVYGITLPAIPATADEAMRLEYVDLSGNAIVLEQYFIDLVAYMYFSEVNGGTMDISGGTNAAIADATTLASIADMIATRGWTITKN